LRDRGIANQIAKATLDHAAQAGCRTLLEIGPGKGAITLPLAQGLRDSSIERFVLCERDRGLAGFWDQQRAQGVFEGIGEVDFIYSDFLELPESAWLSHAPLAVASNLPYSAGTAILDRLARHSDRISVMVLMFQAEVARRLRASSGTKEWGSLSVWIQNQWDVSRLMGVPPRAFAPPPQVDSEVVLLTRREKARLPIPPEPASQDRWEKLLKVSFAHRRKMLRSGLPASGPWRNALELAQLDGTKRAEALAWNDWLRLWNALTELEGRSE